MFIRLGYDMQFQLPCDASLIALLHVHPSRRADLLEPDELVVQPSVFIERYQDSLGNACSRFSAPGGSLRLSGSTLIYDSGLPDPVNVAAREAEVRDLPQDVLHYLLGSRYCEVDLLSTTAWQLFGNSPRGWGRVQAVCDWVHRHITFGYQFARPTRTAMEVFNECVGVCRDFQHLAITFCRCLNIPARYATGYLGDIGVPASPAPMDFSAWFEVYLDHSWWTFDARHNAPRIGRVLMATGADATDVAITTSFGTAQLQSFKVVTEEVSGNRIKEAAFLSSETNV
jgi:transglutaminase-like putative cysteine protease